MVCCSPRCQYVTQLVLYSIFLLLDGLSGAACFAMGTWVPGIGFACASAMIILFIIVRVRLGHKTISELVEDEMERRGLIAGTVNSALVPRSQASAIEADAESYIIEKKTIFRSHPFVFVPIIILLLLGFLAATIVYLVKAIQSHAEFDPFVKGNEWVPFLAFLSGIGPCTDILKLLIYARNEKKKYFLEPRMEVGGV